MSALRPKADVQNARVRIELMSASGRDCVITRDLSECLLSRKQTFRMLGIGVELMSAYGRKQPFVNS